MVDLSIIVCRINADLSSALSQNNPGKLLQVLVELKNEYDCSDFYSLGEFVRHHQIQEETREMIYPTVRNDKYVLLADVSSRTEGENLISETAKQFNVNCAEGKEWVDFEISNNENFKGHAFCIHKKSNSVGIYVPEKAAKQASL